VSNKRYGQNKTFLLWCYDIDFSLIKNFAHFFIIVYKVQGFFGFLADLEQKKFKFFHHYHSTLATTNQGGFNWFKPGFNAVLGFQSNFSEMLIIKSCNLFCLFVC